MEFFILGFAKKSELIRFSSFFINSDIAKITIFDSEKGSGRMVFTHDRFFNELYKALTNIDLTRKGAQCWFSVLYYMKGTTKKVRFKFMKRTFRFVIYWGKKQTLFSIEN